MITSFIQDPKKAIQVGSSQFITETGAYIGRIIRAYAEDSSSGAGFVVLDFLSQSGQKATIKTCVQSINGEETFGANIIHALMTVLKVPETRAVIKTIKDRDGNSFQVSFFSELCQKTVGLFLQRENYLNTKGEEKFSLILLTPFDANTMQTAKEIIEGLEAKDIAHKKESIRDKQRKPSVKANSSAAEPSAGHPASASIDELEDLPF